VRRGDCQETGAAPDRRGGRDPKLRVILTDGRQVGGWLGGRYFQS